MKKHYSFTLTFTVVILIFLMLGLLIPINDSEYSIQKITKINDESNISIPPSIEWNIQYGGIGPDGFSSGQKTSDGGFILTGYTYSFSHGKEDVWVIKTDEHGYEEWNVSFGGISHEQGSSVIQTNDSGYLIVGNKESDDSYGMDVWLIKLDQNGKKVWDKTYGWSSSNTARDIQKTHDENYVICGISQTRDKTGCFLFKIDSTGQVLWYSNYSDLFDYALMNVFSVKQSSDHGLLLTGQIYQYPQGSDGFVLKTDAEGSFKWMAIYGGSQTDFFKGMQCTSDGIIFVGTTKSRESNDFDIWILKTDHEGYELWNTSIGGVSNDEGSHIITCKDNGFIITGYTFSYSIGLSDTWVVKIDDQGLEQWNLTIGSPLKEEGCFCIPIDEQSYTIIGNHHGNGEMIAITGPLTFSSNPFLIFGKINEISEKEIYTNFHADQIMMIGGSPVKINSFNQDEKIYILNNYKAFLSNNIIIGFVHPTYLDKHILKKI